MQHSNFKSVSEFLDYLPEGELAIVNALREIVLESIPDVTERLSYNVPYYYRHRRICFIWPSSIPWGKVEMNGVLLGICEGDLLREDHYFSLADRKKVAARTFFSTSDIDEDLIRYYLVEAVKIDNTFSPIKRKYDT
ncbi:MAG: DUF1801 domain-containing protein [Saprospiraceae bacterium]|nr:DUF1801 domain-containing protein [Saprospiraceae bacterium]